MRRCLLAACCVIWAGGPAFAQDERRVTSPNGQLEFRLFIAQPGEGRLFRLGYEVLLRGKFVVGTSYLGLNFLNQEPVLGENVGLVSARASSEPGRYNSLIAEYMQNGSIGRRLDVEVRIWDGGVAFRYRIPRSTALEEILLDYEATEFRLPARVEPGEASLPYFTQIPGAGWIAIDETPAGTYPRAHLEPSGPSKLQVHLAAPSKDTAVVYEGTPPLVCPWRLVLIGPTRDAVQQTDRVRDMLR